MLCRVEMPMNEQIYGRFYRWKLTHRSGGGANTSVRYGFFLMPVLVVIACVLLWTMGIDLIAIGVLLALVLVYLVYTMVLKPNQMFRKREGAALNTEVYIFTETGFTRSVRSEEGGMPENTSAQYDVLVMAVETGKDFFLFTSPAQAYLVDKEYFTKGTPEELRDMLRKKLGKKFKGKK